LVSVGHQVTVFHRGHTRAEFRNTVEHMIGDRRELFKFRDQFQRLSPEVAIDMIAYTEEDAQSLLRSLEGVVQRVVVVSSADVYRAYDRWRKVYSGPLESVPLTEDAQLREALYPYREKAKGPEDWLYHYEKILVEKAVMSTPDFQSTVLRLPFVYGPGDYQHRTFEFLKRMDDKRPAILLGQERANWRWTWGYVENVGAAIASAATDKRAGRIYNVGEQVALTQADRIEAIAAAAGWKGRIVALPESRLPDHLKATVDFTQDLTFDSGRIRSELGFQEKIPPDEAMRRTIAWEREHSPEEIDPKAFNYPAEDAALKSALNPRE
jgi:nucleoside-diphosphate-sugar epimerase